VTKRIDDWNKYRASRIRKEMGTGMEMEWEGKGKDKDKTKTTG
jgi:hypothetical protein